MLVEVMEMTRMMRSRLSFIRCAVHCRTLVAPCGCQAVRHKCPSQGHPTILYGLATFVYLLMFKHFIQLGTQTGLASPMHSTLLK